MLNDGPTTPLITVLAHLAFGTTVGAFTTLNPHP